MKHFFRNGVQIFLVGALVFLAACKPSTPAANTSWIVGSWRGTFEGFNVLMSFDNDGKFSMYTRGSIVEGTYTIDTQAKPNHLDISVKDTELITTIVEQTDADTFRLEDNLPGTDRPQVFTAAVTFVRNDPGSVLTAFPQTTPTASPLP